MNAEQRPKIRLLGGVERTKGRAFYRLLSEVDARERVFEPHTPVTHMPNEQAQTAGGAACSQTYHPAGSWGSRLPSRPQGEQCDREAGSKDPMGLEVLRTNLEHQNWFHRSQLSVKSC